MRAYQPGAVTSNEVTGQSGQLESKLHTVAEHRPGGPCEAATAGPDDLDVRRACSYTQAALRPGLEPHGSGPAAKPALDGRRSCECSRSRRTVLGAADPELARSSHSLMAEVHWYMLWI